MRAQTQPTDTGDSAWNDRCLTGRIARASLLILLVTLVSLSACTNRIESPNDALQSSDTKVSYQTASWQIPCETATWLPNAELPYQIFLRIFHAMCDTDDIEIRELLMPGSGGIDIVVPQNAFFPGRAVAITCGKVFKV